MKTTRSKKVSTVFNLAADLLESGEIGWARKTWFRKRNGKVCCCAEGAVYAACGFIPDKNLNLWAPYTGLTNKNATRANDVLSRGETFWKRATGVWSFMTFNDRCAKSKKNVIKAFRAAAKEAKAQGD